MPPFEGMLTPKQIVLLAHYVRSHFTDSPAWTDIDRVVAKIDRGPGS
jgi:mono/diheme cytochrome c family protein